MGGQNSGIPHRLLAEWTRLAESMHPKKKKKRIDNAEDFDDFSMVATISKKEYKHYKTLSRNNQIFSADDIVNLKIGDYITLRSYPFDGIGAVVNGINLVTKMVTVTIYPENGSLAIQIPIDNVLYSIYQDYDEDKYDFKLHAVMARISLHLARSGGNYGLTGSDECRIYRQWCRVGSL